MSRRLSLTAAALIGLLSAPSVAQGQAGAGDARPALLPHGRLDADSAAAVGAGLRLFPAPDAALVAPVTPAPVTPAPASLPAPPQALAPPAVKPAAAGPGARPGAQALPSAKPAALPRAGFAAPPASATAFRADPGVSARVRRAVLAAALASSPNPAALRAAVESGAPWQEFDALLRRHGYDPRDLADVVAAYYLIAWEVATAGDALAQPAGIAAVRGQARRLIAATPAMARLSEAERQETAETLAFHAMAIAARHHDLQAAGEAAPLAAFRAEVAEAVAQQQGIDLRRFTLTPAGFQAR
jgi:hypothetical protein